jgi:hypothetical protein
MFIKSSDAGTSPVTVDASTVALIVSKFGLIVLMSFPVGVAVDVMNVAGSSVPTVDQPSVVVGSSVVASVENICNKDELDPSGDFRNRVLTTTPKRRQKIAHSR